ncbi:MAG: hypothetical protein KDI56_07305 [Xanthomonadales bacterium]|nr:hypothetical protein [Xanthomonadales bacterium]MCB1628040.1 hypothetical protein [Xanthomonadales bacterium]
MSLMIQRLLCAWLWLCLCALQTPASAAEQVRLSQASGLGSTQGTAVEPAVAYNADLNQLLVVWWGRDALLSNDGRFLIAGRRVDATTGQAIGPTIRLDSDSSGRNAIAPSVVYNATVQEYLVVWSSETIAGHFELYAQRLAGDTLQPLLPQPRQITEMGGPGDVNHSAFAPALAFNPDRNEYLVAFIGSDSRVGMTDLQRDVFVQRLAGATANEIGTDDMRISTASTADGARQVDPFSKLALAYSSINRNYLVVWSADDPGAGLAQAEYELFAQLIDGATGVEEGTDDARLTTVGPAGNPFFAADQPAVTAEDANFTIAYRADVVQGIKEIHGIRAGGSTGLPFGGQSRLSITTGGAARRPRIAVDTASGELVVAFQAREVLGSSPVFESEVFVQRSTPSLQRIGEEERWSVMGPDGNDDFGPGDILDLAALGASGGYYVAWFGDHDSDGQVDNEVEIFGRSSVVEALFSDGFE